nr:hypothetical protein [uncultured Campylobacter sp.]
MDAKLYLNKAIMQLSRGLEEGGVQSKQHLRAKATRLARRKLA